GELLDQLAEYWRDLMVVRCAGADGQSLSISVSHRAELVRRAQDVELDTILAGLDVLVSAKNRMRATQHHRVLVEMALVRLCRLENLVALAQFAQWAAGERSAGAPATPTRAGPVSTRP